MQEEKDVTNVKRRNVIIDCDPGIDDSLAIMLALSLESISVKGITIVCGNSPVEMGFGNAKKVLHFLKRLDIPIYQGENIKASDNLKIGEINLKRLPKAPEGEQVVKVTFIYDINGILDVNIESSVEKVHKVIVNKQIGLSEKELEKRVEQLEKMPLHPWEKEENRLLFEKAERLYEQTTPKNRQVIQECQRYFKELLINTKGRKVRQEYVRIMAILDYIEQNQVDFGPYDETFWQKEEEDTDE